jgi:hypothetical protein
LQNILRAVAEAGDVATLATLQLWQRALCGDARKLVVEVEELFVPLSLHVLGRIRQCGLAQFGSIGIGSTEIRINWNQDQLE